MPRQPIRHQCAGRLASQATGAHLRLGAQAFAQRFGNIGEDKVTLDLERKLIDHFFCLPFEVWPVSGKFVTGEMPTVPRRSCSTVAATYGSLGIARPRNAPRRQLPASSLSA